MRRLLVIGLLLLAGCQGVVGPFQPRSAQRVDDPLLTINEQEKRSRARLALPDESYATGPKASSSPRSTQW
jgi:hypothetical protein